MPLPTVVDHSSERIRIAVDAMGGDYAPANEVRGSIDVLRETDNRFDVVLVGPEDAIGAELKKQDAGSLSISVVHAPDVVTMHDSPVVALKQKPLSSLVVGMTLHKERAVHAFISAGNTGAVVAASVLYVRRIPGVKRPAICTIMPAMPAPIAFLDVGANAEVRAEFLRQFAIMGQAFAREVMSIPEPSIGLLSIGEEPTKGTPDVIEAHQLIAADDRIGDFYGNIEGRDIMNRLVDVVVTDGFTGNVALKTIEGSARAILGALRATIMLNPLTKFGGLLLQKDLQVLKDALNPEEFGGALLVGMNAPVVIAHGNSRARGIAQAVRMGRRGAVSDLLPTIARELGTPGAAV
jgi:phosphate acyltransferase